VKVHNVRHPKQYLPNAVTLLLHGEHKYSEFLIVARKSVPTLMLWHQTPNWSVESAPSARQEQHAFDSLVHQNNAEQCFCAAFQASRWLTAL
jgi:hypothetical protein